MGNVSLQCVLGPIGSTQLDVPGIPPQRGIWEEPPITCLNHLNWFFSTQTSTGSTPRSFRFYELFTLSLRVTNCTVSAMLFFWLPMSMIIDEGLNTDRQVNWKLHLLTKLLDPKVHELFHLAHQLTPAWSSPPCSGWVPWPHIWMYRPSRPQLHSCLQTLPVHTLAVPPMNTLRTQS